MYAFIVLALALLAGCASAPSAPTEPAAAVTMAPVGYTLVQRGSKTYFCHPSSPTGTRIATQTCITPEQYREEKEQVQALKDTSHRESTCSSYRNGCNTG